MNKYSERYNQYESFLISLLGYDNYLLLLAFASKHTNGKIFGWLLPEFIRECVNDEQINIEAIKAEIVRFYESLKEFYKTNKYCPRCKNWLLVTDFYNKTSYCKDCKAEHKKEKAYAKIYYMNNKDRWENYGGIKHWTSEQRKEYNRNYYQNHKKA
jgi:hypothetical protein